MCFFFPDATAGVVVTAAGPGSPLPPGAGESLRPGPKCSAKNDKAGFAGGSVAFPLSWDSSIPPGIPVSIGTNMLCIAKDWNRSLGVWAYGFDGVGCGDKTAKGLRGDECGDVADRSPLTSLASS